MTNILDNIQLLESGTDCVQWKWSNDKVFSVKSAYSKWEQQQYMEDKALFSVWRNICPPKVELFTWMAMQGSIASRAVLASRGILSQSLDRSMPSV